MLETTKSKAQYLKEARKLVKRRKLKNALELIEDAIVLYPEEPFIMSFHGYLIAAVLKKHKEGVEMCKNALAIYDKKGLVGGEYYHHFFYLNLGRAYLVARNKDFAVRYLRKGLDYDVNNKEIIIKNFKDSFFPYIGFEIKKYFEDIKEKINPDIIFDCLNSSFSVLFRVSY